MAKVRIKCKACDGAGFGDMQEDYGGLREVTCDVCQGRGWTEESEEEWLRNYAAELVDRGYTPEEAANAAVWELHVSTGGD